MEQGAGQHRSGGGGISYYRLSTALPAWQRLDRAPSLWPLGICPHVCLGKIRLLGRSLVCGVRETFIFRVTWRCVPAAWLPAVKMGFFFPPKQCDTGQGLAFEGSLVPLVPGCCSRVENPAFQSIWGSCFAKNPSKHREEKVFVFHL